MSRHFYPPQIEAGRDRVAAFEASKWWSSPLISTLGYSALLVPIVGVARGLICGGAVAVCNAILRYTAGRVAQWGRARIDDDAWNYMMAGGAEEAEYLPPPIYPPMPPLTSIEDAPLVLCGCCCHGDEVLGDRCDLCGEPHRQARA